MVRYIDRYGDIWIQISDWHVQRENDGCLGGWFDGKGLTLLKGKRKA